MRKLCDNHKKKKHHACTATAILAPLSLSFLLLHNSMLSLHMFHFHGLFDCQCLIKQRWLYETTCADATSSNSKQGCSLCEVLHAQYWIKRQFKSINLVLFWWHVAFGVHNFSCNWAACPRDGNPVLSELLQKINNQIYHVRGRH